MEDPTRKPASSTCKENHRAGDETPGLTGRKEVSREKWEFMEERRWDSKRSRTRENWKRNEKRMPVSTDALR